MGWLIPLVMGRAFAPAVVPAHWLVTGAIPFVVYTLLRDPLDAIAVWPYNTVNLVVALASVLGLLWFGSARLGPAPAVALGQLILGILTLFSWRHALARARAREGLPVTAVPVNPELGV
jgi:O-antigen/teichoic acid export membrane protein